MSENAHTLPCAGVDDYSRSLEVDGQPTDVAIAWASAFLNIPYSRVTAGQRVIILDQYRRNSAPFLHRTFERGYFRV